MKTSIPLVCIGFALATVVPALAQRTTRVSVGTGGVQGNAISYSPSITAAGRFVAFFSDANDLVPGDANGAGDVFIRDRVLRTTTLVSVSSSGAQGDYESSNPSISPEGSFIAFQSAATNLVAGPTGPSWDVFVRDLVNGTTECISVDPTGQPANGLSQKPYISAGGRFVSFISNASNLVPGGSLGISDIFVRDVIHATTMLADADANGVEGNTGTYYGAVSYDGHYAVFDSASTNLVPGDTNGVNDVFVKELATGAITRVSVDSNGLQGNSDSGFGAPSISSNGRYVVFGSHASNLVPLDGNGVWDLFVRDVIAGTTTVVSVASDGAQVNDHTYSGTISDDGRFVAFKSPATNLVPDDRNGVLDVFVRDTVRGLTVRVSVNANGREGNSYSSEPVISSDGRSVAFYSESDNLVPFDTNGSADVFVTSLAHVHP